MHGSSIIEDDCSEHTLRCRGLKFDFIYKGQRGK